VAVPAEEGFLLTSVSSSSILSTILNCNLLPKSKFCSLDDDLPEEANDRPLPLVAVDKFASARAGDVEVPTPPPAAPGAVDRDVVDGAVEVVVPAEPKFSGTKST